MNLQPYPKMHFPVSSSEHTVGLSKTKMVEDNKKNKMKYTMDIEQNTFKLEVLYQACFPKE